MRLSAKTELLRQLLAKWPYKSKEETISSSTYVKFSNLNEFKGELEKLKNNDILEKEINELYSTNIFSTGEEHLQDVKTGRRTDETVTNFHSLLKSIVRLLDTKAIEEEVEENVVWIKLPDTDSLEVISKDTKAFEVILSQVIINNEIEGVVKVIGVEQGSMWLKVLVGTKMAVILIGGIAWSAAVISKKWSEAALMKQMVEQQGLDQQHKQTVSDAYDIMLKALVEAETNYILNEHAPDSLKNDPEYVNRLKNSLNMLAEEFHRGGEIAPALTAPEEVKNLFPDMKLLPTIQSKIKQIENKKE